MVDQVHVTGPCRHVADRIHVQEDRGHVVGRVHVSRGVQVLGAEGLSEQNSTFCRVYCVDVEDLHQPGIGQWVVDVSLARRSMMVFASHWSQIT